MTWVQFMVHVKVQVEVKAKGGRYTRKGRGEIAYEIAYEIASSDA